MRRAGRFGVLVTSFACLSWLTLASCTTTEEAGQTEPGVPGDEVTPYPEDPDMAKADDPSAVPPESSPDDEPVGELTDDPFKKDGSAGDEPPPAVAEDGLPVPDEGEPYTESFEDPNPGLEGAAPGTAPVVPPPATGDDIATPAPDTGSDMHTDAPVAGAPRGKETRYVDAILLNVRSGPRQRAPIVRRLLGGAKIYVVEKGDWAQIKSGQWVRSKYLSASPTKRVSRAEAEKAWSGSRYKDTWKPKR